MLGAFHKGSDFTQKRKIIPIVRENQNLWKDGFFYSVVPIVHNDIHLGHLVVIASLHDFYIRMIQNGVVIVLVILFALLMTSKFRQMWKESILNPIAQLDEVTTEIIKTKHLHHDMPTFNDDEIGDLAKNFSHMLYELNAYHDELNAQKDIFAHQANHDSLTNLPNRSLFNDRLHQSIYKAKRQEEQFALFFIDLDQFKEINDTFGHDYGDNLLKQVARRLKSIMREEDTLARLGGDEFTIIMNNLKEPHSASVLAQKILDVLRLPIELREQQTLISCSIGISLFPQDANEAHELVKNADIAMYRAKADGRNTYHFYTEALTEQVLQRVAMQSKLRRALDEREFVIYYQPQYDIPTDSIIGLEALVRWIDPHEGMISPANFIPLAEELGFVTGINHQVMQMAMRQAKAWSDQGIDFGRVSINISIGQIEDKNYVNQIQSMLQEAKCKPQWITLELTEGQIMKNPEVAIETLIRLNYLGIEIAVDDFGTGHSSLAYLKRLRIHELKIDQSFVRDLPDDEDDIAIVEAIIAIAKSMNISLIAEGVETVEQRDFLLERRCNHAQGYLYARPMPSDEITKLLITSHQINSLDILNHA